MLRISKMTDYATVLLARLASVPDRQLTAGQLSTLTRLTTPTVSKVMKLLHRRQLVSSTRGLHGGYRLARPAADITAAQILDALEGPMALIECAQRPHRCGIESTCGVGRAWQRVNLAIRRSLQEITLLELAGLGGEPVGFAAMERQLRGSRSPTAGPVEPGAAAALAPPTAAPARGTENP
ncbi:MAG TPA: SUF system Fe-S cluster assembly regulator [Steroidobacteraceae bacterium]|nr:SUF system Fe-S cluster assembly regulator [Steroidobacteraceae bacterium]